MKSNKTTPEFAVWLLSRFLFGKELLEKLGDLEEDFIIKQKEIGIFKARTWYWKQTLLTIPVCIKNMIAWGIIMFQNYFKIAIRNIKRHKVFSFINIFGLALGMACCVLILLWVQDEISYDKFHVNGENIYRLVVSDGERNGSSSPWALAQTLKKDFPEFLKGTRFITGTYNVRYKENKFYETGVMVDEDFLDMFTFPFIKGNKESALSNINSVLITEEMAVKYFGADDPLGKTITIGNNIDLIVTGILENVPPNSHMKFSFLIRPEIIVGEARMNGWSFDGPSYVLLKSGININEVEKKISGTIIKYDKRFNLNITVGLQPFNKIYLYSLSGTDPVVYIYIFSGIAVIVLLIACINFMNLTTAKSSQRAKEIGMRKVIGAQRGDIIKQFFGESIVLAFLALAIAIVIVYLFLPIFNELAEKELVLNFINNSEIVIGLFLIALFTGIISGTYPALYLSSFRPVQVLKNSVIKGSGRHTFRRILIVFQFSAAVVLIISTSVILKQMQYIRTKDVGYNREHILRVTLDEILINKYDTVKKELLKEKNVYQVSAANNIPLNINSFNPFWWEGRPQEDYKIMNFVCVDLDYFEMFGMKLKMGRMFMQDLQSDSTNYIINETALKITGFDDPVGKRFSMWKKEGKIIGVLQDFNSNSLHDEIQPAAFMIYSNTNKRNLFVKINSLNIASSIAYIEKTLSRFSPNFIFDYNFLDEDFNKQYKSEEHLANLLKYFTILAIFISCLGLLGLASFMAEEKRKEIAIRKVLGANISGIVSGLSKDFIKLILVANLIAAPIAYYFMSGWVQSFAFHTSIDWEIFLLAGVIALGTAALTIGIQVVKAANRNPVDNLKCE
ncbi:MAG: ABC transporter permease [Bacteroidetes bacterium]|nr:ABC transporter permease [Bacteroidota bacterium]